MSAAAYLRGAAVTAASAAASLGLGFGAPPAAAPDPYGVEELTIRQLAGIRVVCGFDGTRAPAEPARRDLRRRGRRGHLLRRQRAEPPPARRAVGLHPGGSPATGARGPGDRLGRPGGRPGRAHRRRAERRRRGDGSPRVRVRASARERRRPPRSRRRGERGPRAGAGRRSPRRLHRRPGSLLRPEARPRRGGGRRVRPRPAGRRGGCDGEALSRVSVRPPTTPT